MSEGHKLFGFGKETHRLDEVGAGVLYNRKEVMNGGVYWVAYALQNSRPEIKAAIDAELTQQTVNTEPADLAETMPYPQEADHQLLANAALAASVNVPTMPETPVATDNLDIHGPDVALDTDAFMRTDASPLTSVEGRQSDYDLAGGQ